MKLLKRADRLDVKRACALTHFVRKFGIAGRYDVAPPTKAEYVKALAKAHTAVKALSEKELDKIIGYKKRIRAYSSVDWYVGTVSPKEVGVWKGAGGLPVTWTRGSLSDTAAKVKLELQKNSRAIRMRSKRAIPAIISLKSVIAKDTFSYPIVFTSGTGTEGRKGLPKMKGDIDDGNMRSIAFALTSSKPIRAYIGVPK